VALAEQAYQDRARNRTGEIVVVETESQKLGPLNCRLQRYVVEEVI
jgi:hypothetical protein